MGIIQQASGTFSPASTNINVTLPGAVQSGNVVAVFVCGNTIVSAPGVGGFTLRHSQVNFAGHYFWETADTTGAWTFTTSPAGGGMWYAAEIEDGIFDVTNGSNGGSDTSYTTPAITPTSGTRIVIASVGGVAGSAGAIRTITAWSNSFVEQADAGVGDQDSPMGGIATLGVTANGSTAYSTTATFSGSLQRTAIIGAYSTTATGNATATPAVIAVTAALPAAAVQAGGDVAVAPTAIAATAALPAPTVTAQNNATVTPGVIAATVALTDWAVDIGAGPETIAVTAALPAAISGQGTTVQPATITATTALPAATVAASVTVAPATIATVVALPAASTGAGVTVAPAAVTAVASLPSVTIQTSGNVTVAATVIAATVALPQVSVSGGGVVVEAAIYTGNVTGPARFVESYSGPATARDVDGPALARTVTGPGAQT